MSDYKNLENFVNYSVKIISLLIFLFLLINFIFNAGYFFIIGNKFLSLLTISDYYEGSAPLMSVTILSFAAIFNAIFLNKHVRASFVYFNLIFSSKVSGPIRILLIKLKTNTLYIFNHSKYTYADKRLLIKIRKELKSIKNEMNENIKDLKNFNSLVSWTLAFIIILPIIVIFINSFLISMRIFYILLMIYVCIIVFASKKESIAKYYSLTVLSVLLIFCLGLWCFLRDYSLDTVAYVPTTKNDIHVIRPISRGIIVKCGKEVSFIDWNGKTFFNKNLGYMINVLITNSDYERQKNVEKSIEIICKKWERYRNKGIKSSINLQVKNIKLWFENFRKVNY